MAVAGTVRSLVALAACLVLAACLGQGAVQPPGSAPVVPVEPTAKSIAAATYYAQVQQLLLSQGMLRTDGGEGIPVSARALTENFMRVALYDEYRRGSGGFVREETESRLRRWEVPIRVGIRFGPSVSPERQATDRARIGSFVARLAGISGHPMAVDERNPNFFVYIVSEDEREALGPVINATLPGLSPVDVAGITQMPRST